MDDIVSCADLTITQEEKGTVVISSFLERPYTLKGGFQIVNFSRTIPEQPNLLNQSIQHHCVTF